MGFITLHCMYTIPNDTNTTYIKTSLGEIIVDDEDFAREGIKVEDLYHMKDEQIVEFCFRIRDYYYNIVDGGNYND